MVSDPHPHILLPIETPDSLNHEVEGPRRALKEKEKELDKPLLSRDQVKKSTENTNHQGSGHLVPVERIQNLEERYHHLRKESREHRARCQARERHWEARHNDLQLRYDQASQLLQTRTTELRAAQNFLSIEDSRSVEDVVQLVHDLNSEIVQASAALVESLVLQPTVDPSDIIRQTAAVHVSGLVGPLAAKLLCSFRGEDDIDVLEVIFRGSMVAWAHKIIDAWHLGPGGPGELSGLYEMIHAAEEQAVAGRWRMLTRRNIQREVHAGSNMFNSTSPRVVGSLADAILCAGLAREHDFASKLVMDGLGQKLLSVMGMAHKLNKVLGEDITSSDMQVTSVKGGGKYDKSSMENTHDDRADVDWDGTTVICTADLGLQMRGKVNGKQTHSILFRHKVALEGFMD